MRKIIKLILKPFVKNLYPLVQEIVNEKFEQSGINHRNQLVFLRGSAVIPASTHLMKDITILNKQNNPSKITFGESCRIGKGAELLVFKNGGEIIIGNNTLVNAGCRLHSLCKITIGSRVLLSYNVFIFDNNSHPLNPEERALHWNDENLEKKVDKKEIQIEDDVWIGANAIILKGVTLGRGSIIAAGSVVTNNVEPMTIVAGNPAREIKKITN